MALQLGSAGHLTGSVPRRTPLATSEVSLLAPRSSHRLSVPGPACAYDCVFVFVYEWVCVIVCIVYVRIWSFLLLRVRVHEKLPVMIKLAAPV